MSNLQGSVPEQRCEGSRRDTSAMNSSSHDDGHIKRKNPNNTEHQRGGGGGFDNPVVRTLMRQVTSSSHPLVYHGYHHGQGIPPQNDWTDVHQPVFPNRPDPPADVLEFGGSMRTLTHSENGLLQSFDPTWYQELQV